MKLTEHYSENVLKMARSILNDGGVHQNVNDSNKFMVKGSKFYTVYRLELGEDEDGELVEDDGMPFVTCDCPNGLHLGGRPQCKHSAAVIMLLEEIEEPDE